MCSLLFIPVDDRFESKLGMSHVYFKIFPDESLARMTMSHTSKEHIMHMLNVGLHCPKAKASNIEAHSKIEMNV
jgi:hypothetical protein